MTRIQENVRSALDDTPLNKAVLNATVLSTTKRDQIISELTDYEQSRNKARAVRENALSNLDENIAQFRKKFEEHGGTVHLAENAEQACTIIVGILRNHNARNGVKSKSMVSEEIALNRAIEQAGISVVESDLGEFIVQLAGEPPSHITAPALHRSRQSIGRLFSEKLGVEYTEDPAELTKIARQFLRERFLSADFAISGGNFFIAETGHIVLVENEGNAKMGLSVPPLYIALTGIEKVLAEWEDLPPVIDLLPRSATGQRFSGYLHLLRPGDGLTDGPRELHIVLLDNGRRKGLSDPVLREMLLCIRCGACLNICPVYRSVGGHAYDSVYPGPMGAIWSNIVGDEESHKPELAYLSTLCSACRDVCPVRIDIPKLLLELRGRASKGVIESGMAKGWEWAMMSPGRYRLMAKLAHRVSDIAPVSPVTGWLKGKGKGFSEGKG